MNYLAKKTYLSDSHFSSISGRSSRTVVLEYTNFVVEKWLNGCCDMLLCFGSEAFSDCNGINPKS